MDRLKAFIESKKRDKKFKNAGKGLTLNNTLTSTSSTGKATSPKHRRADTEAIAKAAERRLEQANEARGGQSLSAGQRRVREQALRELQAEQAHSREASATSGTSLTDKRAEEQHLEHGEQISTILYTCNLLDSDIALPKHEIIKEIEKTLRALLDSEPIDAASIMILALNSPHKLEQGLPILLKYIKNVLQAPEETKYRRIKTSNKIYLEKVAPLTGSLDLLKAIGFVEDDQQNADGGSDSFLALSEPDEEKTADMLNAVTMLEGDNPMSLKLYRDPKIFRIDHNRRTPMPDVPVDFFDRTTAEIKREQEQRAKAIQQMTTLRTSAMREADARPKQSYRYTLLRVRFPNDYVLQGVFNTQEKVAALREFIADRLAFGAGVFTLTDPTTKQRLDDDEKSFVECGLAPAAIVLFEWDGETSAQFASQQAAASFLRAEDEQTATLLT